MHAKTLNRISIFVSLISLSLALQGMQTKVGAAKSSPAQGATKSSIHRKASLSPVVPFDLVLGSTSIEDAKTRWIERDAKIASSGSAAVGAGSGVDGMGAFSDPHIWLIDISQVELEGVPARNVRFAFMDNTLYSVSVKLKDVVANAVNRNFHDDQVLDDKSMSALRKSLTERYGPPTILNPWFGKFFIWDFKEKQLVLEVGRLSSSLTYRHKGLAKKAEASKEAVCRQHRPQCSS